MRRKSLRLLAAFTCTALLVAACSDDEEKSEDTTAGTTADTTTEDTTEDTTETTTAVDTAWMVNTDDCIDPDSANAVIEGEIKIGSVMPLTGDTSADEAFAPVKDGWLAYMDYANEQGILGDITISASVEDDQYAAEQTPGAVSKLIDNGVHLLSGIIGSPNNLAVRDTLNEECIPQLGNLTGLPAWGDDVEDYPWTTGGLVPYDVETRVYMESLQSQGITKVALIYVNTEFGKSYADTAKAEAAEFGLEIVADETIDPTDPNPPAGQVTTIAAAAPEAIIAVPLGAGCISFLNVLAEKKAQTPGWEPLTYVTNTCASSLILGIAGANADGLYTSNALIDATDPKNAEDPDVKAYVDYMNSIGKGDLVTTASTGWTVAEVVVAIIKQAMESPEGLTRASIINAARNFEYESSLARPGVKSKTSGLDDAFPAESLQVLQYDADTKTFTEIGELITKFESS